MVAPSVLVLAASATLAVANPLFHLRPPFTINARSPVPTARPLIDYDKAVAAPVVTAAPVADEKLAKRGACTFTGSAGAASASKSQASCATIVLSGVTVPSGKALTLDKMKSGTSVIFEGVTTFEYAEWEGPLVTVKGKNIKVSCASGAYLDGQGDKYWDGKGGNGGVTKPKFFAAHSLTGGSTITNLYLKNSPVQAMSISGADGLTITDFTLDNKAGAKLGHNTDAFDIGDSNNVVITGANVYNQDDCVAINSGTSITVQNSLCSGGHGLSIGSVGGRDDNTVKTVKFLNNVVESSANGCRIKAKSGATGSISDVTYQDITLKGITGYGILIEQNYNGGDLHGDPTTGVPITGLTMSSISGSGGVSSSATNIAIVCGSGSCSGWTWSGVKVTGGKKYGSCKNVPSGASC